MSPSLDSRPLQGIKIVSVAEQFPGPYATLLLSDLGADVVQVERPGSGDPARQYPALFAALNRGKRSITLDLKDAAQNRACRALMTSSDVVVEGFRPGVVDRLGLGSESLTTAKPGLVYVSISGFGQDSPQRALPGHDLSFQAMTGLIDTTDGVGRLPHVALADVAAGTFAAMAVLIGLFTNSTTGRGGVWDVSMLDALTSFITVPLTLEANGQDLGTLGQDPGYGCFVTADARWLALSIAFEDHFWSLLCHTIGLAALADVTGQERIARQDELRAAVADKFASAPVEHWYAMLSEAGVPCTIVGSMADLLSSPHMRQRALIHETRDGRSALRQPLVVDGAGWGPIRAAPALGEHTEEILAEIGLTDASWRAAPSG